MYVRTFKHAEALFGGFTLTAFNATYKQLPMKFIILMSLQRKVSERVEH